ncbi:MAG: porin family protein [Gammaproteobacteria bacterium]|nr:porin family protein [Gammaproteobacteria bacterium]
MKNKIISFVLSAIMVFGTAPVAAEYYVSADAVYMDIKTVYANGASPFEIGTARIKFGRRFEEFGWEFQAILPAEDTGVFSRNGDIDKFEIRGAIGLMLTASSKDRRYYGGIGFTQIISDYTVTTGAIAGASSTNTTPFLTLNFGGQIKINKNARLTLDYTFYYGDIDCDFCITIPNGTEPDVRINSIGAGFSYAF